MNSSNQIFIGTCKVKMSSDQVVSNEDYFILWRTAKYFSLLEVRKGQGTSPGTTLKKKRSVILQKGSDVFRNELVCLCYSETHLCL